MGKHLRTKDRDSEHLMEFTHELKHRYALNLSCEKAELLYAAFWTHSG